MLLNAIINPPPRRAGRPPDVGNERKRALQIRVVAYLILGNFTAAEIALAVDVSESTIWTWKRRLLADGRQDTDALREIQCRVREARSRTPRDGAGLDSGK